MLVKIWLVSSLCIIFEIERCILLEFEFCCEMLFISEWYYCSI